MQFLSRCKMLDNGLLEKSAVGKLLPRFSKRGTDRVKQLARTIETNAIAASKKKKESLKSSGSGTGSGKDSKPSSGIQSPPSTAGVKRPRPSDASGDQPLKKPSAKAGEAQGVKKPAASGATGVGAKAGGSSTSTANKGSSNPVVAKSSSFISSLQSAKRPSAAKGVNGPAKAAPKYVLSERTPALCPYSNHVIDHLNQVHRQPQTNPSPLLLYLQTSPVPKKRYQKRRNRMTRLLMRHLLNEPSA